MSLSIHNIYRQIFKIWRRRRFAVFLRLATPRPSDLILDVGGTPWFWSSSSASVKQIDVLNIAAQDVGEIGGARFLLRSLVGDGCRLEMGDKSYDIAFSNSVIEHVGSWERQQQFAKEIRRVGKAVWVQTPAHECPIEPHYLTPLVHYLPVPVRRAIARWFTVWGLLEKPTPEQVKEMVETTRLLRKREMRELFPDCQILTERLLWIIPKSYIAFRPRG